MARKPAPRVAAAKPNNAPLVNKGVLLVLLAALVPFSLPTVIVGLVTLLPTLVAWFTERGENKYAWLCVGGVNFAGVVPYLFGLWFGVHNLDEAFRLLTDASVLLVAYGCAAIGWLLYMGIPPVVGSYLAFISQRRIAALQNAQKKLVDEWGEDVSRKGGVDAAPQAPSPER